MQWRWWKSSNFVRNCEWAIVIKDGELNRMEWKRRIREWRQSEVLITSMARCTTFCGNNIHALGSSRLPWWDDTCAMTVFHSHGRKKIHRRFCDTQVVWGASYAWTHARTHAFTKSVVADACTANPRFTRWIREIIIQHVCCFYG